MMHLVLIKRYHTQSVHIPVSGRSRYVSFRFRFLHSEYPLQEDIAERLKQTDLNEVYDIHFFQFITTQFHSISVMIDVLIL